MRRSNDALYFSGPLIGTINSGGNLGLWEFANVFFPKETNPRQFNCAFTLFQKLRKNGQITNTAARIMFDDNNDKTMLMGNVIPKLRKFGLIETDGASNAKKYNIRFSKKFSQKLQHISLEWIEESLKK